MDVQSPKQFIIRKKIGEKIHISKSKKRIKVPEFSYCSSNGRKITSEKTLKRIKKLCIPPMWTEVEISSSDTDYLQVTGKDDKGRTQYIYHPLFVALTDSEKYIRLGKFCKKLHLLNKKVSKDFASGDLSKKDFIMALMFKIMKKTHSRIGNESYAEDNNTFGLTTLTKSHLKINKNTVIFDFLGKKSVRQVLKFTDKNIANVIRKLKELKGSRLFKTSKGQSIKSNDMNDYLREAMGEEFSCKDFRTYASNLLFIEKLCDLPLAKTKKEIKENLKNTYDKVADELGHTRAISKSSYVMPLIADKYTEDPSVFLGNKRKSKTLLIKFTE